MASVSEPHSTCGERQRATFHVWRAKRATFHLWRAKRATFPCGERSEPPTLHTCSRPRPRVGGWRAWAGTPAALPALCGHAVRLAAQGWQGCTPSLGCFGGRAVRPHGIGAEQPLLLYSANSCFVLLPLAFAGQPVRATQQGQNGNSTHPLSALLTSTSCCCRLPLLGSPSGLPSKGKTATALTLIASNE